MAFAVEEVMSQLCPQEQHGSASDSEDDEGKGLTAEPKNSLHTDLSQQPSQDSLRMFSDRFRPEGNQVWAGYREFCDYMKTYHAYDPYLGLRPEDLTKIWDSHKVFRAAATMIRASLNLYESLKMMIDLDALWLHHHKEDTDIGFLQRHRIWWVSGVCALEFAVLWTCLIMYLPYAIAYITGCIKPRAEVLIGSPMFIANFSVLQFAMYAGPDDFLRQALWMRVRRGAASWWWRYVRGVEDLDEIPCYTRSPHLIEWVTWLVMWMMFVFLGIVAFLTKMSFEVGSVLFHDIATWRMSDWTSFFAFVNNALNIVDIDNLSRHRLMSFRFSGHDATWTPREVALMKKYDRMIGTLLEGYLGSRVKSTVALATLRAKEFQQLLIVDSGDRSHSPSPWMFKDIEYRGSGTLACLGRLGCFGTVRRMPTGEGLKFQSWLYEVEPVSQKESSCLKSITSLPIIEDLPTTPDQRQEHFDKYFTPRGDFTALVEEMNTYGSLDPHLGLEPNALMSLWGKWRYWVLLIAALRGMLNIYEASSMLFIDVSDLWLRDMSGNEVQRFLQRHRRYWITGVALLEFSVLIGTLAIVVVHYARYLSFRESGKPSVLLNYLRRVADFSVLQFAMYMNSHVLEFEASYWLARIDMQAWLVATCGGSQPLGERQHLVFKRMAYVVVYGSIAAFVLVFVSAGLIAFLTKMSFEVGGILFKNMNEWSWSELFKFIGFVNNCIGIVETDRLMRNRMYLFAFEGREASWTAGGVAMRRKYERMLVRLSEEYLGSRWRSLVLLGTFTHRDLQHLLVSTDAAGIEDKMIAPEAWMYHDLESSGTQDDTDSDDTDSDSLMSHSRERP